MPLYEVSIRQDADIQRVPSDLDDDMRRLRDAHVVEGAGSGRLIVDMHEDDAVEIARLMPYAEVAIREPFPGI